MIFSSLVFLFTFLPLTILGSLLAKNVKYKNVLLLIASLLFYAWGEKDRVLIMIFSILINYFIGIWIENKPESKTPLTVGVIINLLLITIFKYANFIVDNINVLFGSSFELAPIPLPIGISFFTFQSISYLIDVRRKTTPAQRNLVHLGLYISLFPQLIAGPIVRYHDVAEQIKKRFINAEKLTNGIERFVLGLSKKILLANTFGFLADQIFNTPFQHLSTPLAWLGIVSYAMQIFFDFSGYSDMAIGLGKIFGFDFLENFNLPYISKSIQEFWRRWHISLSNWFKDYLYIPLGGNRLSETRTYFNLFLVFLTTGIWHGASWNFIIWGLFHGLFLILERLGLSKVLDKLPNFVAHAYTLLVVLIGWVFFRSESLTYSVDFVNRLFVYTNTPETQYTVSDFLNSEYIITIVLGVLFSTNIPTKATDWLKAKYGSAHSVFMYFGLVTLFMLCLLSLINSSYNPFIYFRF